MNFKILRFIDRFRAVFEKLGIDYPMMRRILEIKLIMDGRRIPTIMNNSSKKKSEKKEKNNFFRSLWIYVLMGIFMIPFIIMDNSYIFQMSIVFGIFIFMIMTSLISDFSAVFLDIRDKNIIFSKPVSNKTYGMAKTIHVLIYMFYITISLTGIPLAVSFVKHGILFFGIFLFEIILMDLFIVTLTALLYLLILKFFDGEKLKDVINYVQIILTITITVGYQLIGRLFGIIDLNVIFLPRWWQYLIIPVWFGAPFELFIHNNYNSHYIAFSVLAVLASITSIMAYIKLIPVFERYLQKLSNDSGKEKGLKNKGLLQRLNQFICRDREERIFFRFASVMINNEREFKLKVYPSLGFSLIFPFIFIFNQLQYREFAEIAAGKSYFNIYFCALLLPTVIMMMKYSGKYTGAWIYHVFPIKKKASIFKGTLKAILIKLLLPVYILECFLFTGIFGIRIFWDLIIVFLNIILFTVICFKILKKSLPFSEAFEAASQSQGFTLLPLMIVIGVLGGVHFAVTLFDAGIYILLVFLIVANIIVWKKAFANICDF